VILLGRSSKLGNTEEDTRAAPTFQKLGLCEWGGGPTQINAMEGTAVARHAVMA
jgi:hypothetical protein